MVTPNAQLESFVADVILPRIDEVMDAATNGVNDQQLRYLFNQNIRDAMKFFYDRWTPVYLELHGQKKTAHASQTLDELTQEVIQATPAELQLTVVKALWFLLSISLEDMDAVPVFPDELTFSQLDSAIKSATHRITQ